MVLAFQQELKVQSDKIKIRPSAASEAAVKAEKAAYAAISCDRVLITGSFETYRNTLTRNVREANTMTADNSGVSMLDQSRRTALFRRYRHNVRQTLIMSACERDVLFGRCDVSGECACLLCSEENQSAAGVEREIGDRQTSCP